MSQGRGVNISTYKGKLTFIYSLSIFSLIFLLSSIVYFKLRSEVDSITDTLLLQEARKKVTELKKQISGTKPEEKNTEINEVIEIVEKSRYNIKNTEHGILLESKHPKKDVSYLNPQVIKKILKKGYLFQTIHKGHEKIRLLYMRIDEQRLLKFTASFGTQKELIKGLNYIFVVFLLISLGVSPLIGWALAGLAVAPIINITNEVHSIGNNNLKNRLSMNYKGMELNNLSLVINSILDKIEKVAEYQKRFTAEVSHEIRTPLTIIKGNIEVTIRRRRNPEEYEEILKSNLIETDRLIRIVNNIFFLARVDIGAMEINLKAFNLSLLVERILTNFEYIVTEKGLSTKCFYKEDIFLHGDELLISQLFSNLIDNAINYTPRGGKIAIYLTQDKDGVMITVRDTGIGIPKNELPMVFKRFYRVDSNRFMNESGSGLGLYMCKWIVNFHGGKINVESEIGKGTNFYVFIPNSEK